MITAITESIILTAFWTFGINLISKNKERYEYIN